jgi:uncharacterized protein (DUF1501 family)
VPTLNPTRRSLLLAGGALALVGSARAAPAVPAPLVVMILRGGLDGLAAVPPTSDPAYARRRGALAISGALPLTPDFGLHPSLAFLGERFAAQELAVLHAASTPYRDRSHFDGQDVLESGVTEVFGAGTGWLSRALAQRGSSGVAVGSMVPLLLRGPGEATSWTPSKAGPPNDDTLARLSDLYRSHPVLADELAKAQQTAALLEGVSTGNEPAELVRACAAMLLAPGGPEAAVISVSGWDTHANQGAGEGALANRLKQLDAGLRTLHDALGPAWAQTQVLVLTEFGRTVAVNGTKGTDHGTGTVAFLVGGAVRGGRVLGDWPTLARLHEDRDLVPANDVRTLVAGVLAEHWGVEGAFDGVRPMTGLARG